MNTAQYMYYSNNNNHNFLCDGTRDGLTVSPRDQLGNPENI